MKEMTESEKILTFISQYEKIEKAAQAVLPVVAKATLSEREYRRTSDFELTGISDQYLTLVGGYNDACNCHPEYRTAHVHIEWKTIEDELAKQGVVL